MSNFRKETKHPITGEWEMADWIDDKMGRHIYGVSFPSQPTTYYNADEFELETREAPNKHTAEGREEWKLQLATLLQDLDLSVNEPVIEISLWKFISRLLADQQATLKKELAGEVEKGIEDYFKGLLMIPFPQATKVALKEFLLARLK